MKNKLFYSLAAVLLSLPSYVFAQFGGIKGMIVAIGGLVRQLITVAFGAALLAFVWGIAKFINAQSKGDQKGIDNGKELMKWGVIALFVLVSVWGIVAFIQRELNLPVTVPDSQKAPQPSNQVPGAIRI